MTTQKQAPHKGGGYTVNQWTYTPFSYFNSGDDYRFSLTQVARCLGVAYRTVYSLQKRFALNIFELPNTEKGNQGSWERWGKTCQFSDLVTLYRMLGVSTQVDAKGALKTVGSTTLTRRHTDKMRYEHWRSMICQDLYFFVEWGNQQTLLAEYYPYTLPLDLGPFAFPSSKVNVDGYTYTGGIATLTIPDGYLHPAQLEALEAIDRKHSITWDNN